MAPTRFKVAPAYDKAAAKLSSEDRKRAHKAILRFLGNPSLPGLNFEPIHGEPSLFSIRASRAIRIVLRRDRDEQGDVWVAVNVGSHSVYRRR